MTRPDGNRLAPNSAFPHRNRDPVRPLSLPYRLWLWLEMLAIFVGAPLGLYVLVYGYRQPLFIVLPALFLAVALILTIDGRFIWLKMITVGVNVGQLLHILCMFAILGAWLALYAKGSYPDTYLRFYRNAPDLWLKVMILYPLVSASVQEILFRVFFFHRYRELFGHQTWLLVLVNAVLFAYAHIIFQNWPAIWLSLIAGLLFAWRYERTRSFWAVFIEHSLYGNLIFTVGFGRFFYTGVSNIPAAQEWFARWDAFVRWLGF